METYHLVVEEDARQGAEVGLVYCVHIRFPETI